MEFQSCVYIQFFLSLLIGMKINATFNHIWNLYTVPSSHFTWKNVTVLMILRNWMFVIKTTKYRGSNDFFFLKWKNNEMAHIDIALNDIQMRSHECQCLCTKRHCTSEVQQYNSNSVIQTAKWSHRTKCTAFINGSFDYLYLVLFIQCMFHLFTAICLDSWAQALGKNCEKNTHTNTSVATTVEATTVTVVANIHEIDVMVLSVFNFFSSLFRVLCALFFEIANFFSSFFAHAPWRWKTKFIYADMR